MPSRNPKRRDALDGLFSATYEELRRLAAAVKRADANATIGTLTLVHEAWIKLAGSGLRAGIRDALQAIGRARHAPDSYG